MSGIRKPSSTLHMPNTTSTDLFCNAQLVLPVPGVSPQERQVLLAGGDKWPRTDHTANPDVVIFDPGTNSLTKSVTTMNQPRWYASPTTLANGETYLQGGMGGEANPEIRDSSGTFRELSNVHTQDIVWWYPRNRVAPDGRIFGYSDRQMYYVDPNGQGRLTLAGTMPANGPSGNTSTDVMYAPGKILRVGGGAAQDRGDWLIAEPGQERGSGDRHQRNVADLQTSLLDAGCAALGQRHGHRRWPGRRHRR